MGRILHSAEPFGPRIDEKLWRFSFESTGPLARIQEAAAWELEISSPGQN
jgi:hypothetical protein